MLLYHITGTIRLVPRNPELWDADDIERIFTMPIEIVEFVAWRKMWLRGHKILLLRRLRGIQDFYWLDGPHFRRVAWGEYRRRYREALQQQGDRSF